ncbi:MAG: hypothetical protein K8F93_15825 [Burkholderiales bacterium]|nr:hypothetical protein [Burkholderiales bacterium]MBZ0251125.1 hypothetical protein [Burkholderiales bacterium]
MTEPGIVRKRRHRLYREAGLQARRRRRERIVMDERTPIERARVPNELVHGFFGRLSEDFAAMSSSMTSSGSGSLRKSTHRSPGRISREMDEAIAGRGSPVSITVDNGREFAGRVLDE